VEVEVIVEIPQGSRNKYEMDHETGRIRLDRMLFTSTRYPLDYGFIPDTLAEDSDPLDAMIMLEEPTFPGCQITVRPIGVFWMSDEHGPDAKILTVPAHDPRFTGIQDLDDVPPHVTGEIGHFFDIYKELEPGKSTDVRGWQDRACALEIIDAAFRRARDLTPARISRGDLLSSSRPSRTPSGLGKVDERLMRMGGLGPPLRARLRRAASVYCLRARARYVRPADGVPQASRARLQNVPGTDEATQSPTNSAPRHRPLATRFGAYDCGRSRPQATSAASIAARAVVTRSRLQRTEPPHRASVTCAAPVWAVLAAAAPLAAICLANCR